MTRTAKSARLSQHLAEPFVEIHPTDARRAGIGDADIVRVSNASRSILARALLTDRQARGAVFVPMHWTDQFAARARVDTLVPQRMDPHSGQPAFKNSAVRIERFAAARYGFAVLRDAPRALEADYWALAKCPGGWRLELAFSEADRDWSSWARSLLESEYDAQVLAYHDMAAGQHRFACFAGDRLVGAFFFASEPVAVSRDWAVEQLGAKFASGSARLALVAGRPARGLADRGALVCSCFGIGVNQIAAAITAGCRSIEAVGAATQAGTNCGSCRAEIKAILALRKVQAAE
jgi:assimilatory nitrate reductase catalytic subunit